MTTPWGHIFRFAAAAPERPGSTVIGELPEGPKTCSAQAVSAHISDLIFLQRTAKRQAD